MTEQNKRQPYPSDLTDAEWQQIEPLLPKRKSPRGRRRVHSFREILNAIFYVLRSSCAWRMLPHDLPPWQTVYHSFRLWRQDGTWARINDILQTELPAASGRDPQPSAAGTASGCQPMIGIFRHSLMAAPPPLANWTTA